MYTPAHFAMTAAQMAEVLGSSRAGDLITNGPDGLVATFVPMLYEADGSEFGRLVGHLSLVNDQWRCAESGERVEALFLLHGPEGFVDASWLSTSTTVGVPTWNYVTVHAWGEFVVHTDAGWKLGVVRKLSAAHGDASVDELGPAELAGMLRAIVGVELRISRLAGKAKMSQNKTPETIRQVVDGLRASGNAPAADWMELHSLPRAQAKAEMLEGLRGNRRVRDEPGCGSA